MLGFTALATTSSGFAWSLGRSDTTVTLDEALAHLEAIAGAVERAGQRRLRGRLRDRAGGCRRPTWRARSRPGSPGISIEDSTGDAAAPLFDFDLAVERIRAARAAIDASGTGVLLTGRSEGFIAGRPDLAETIRRLTAYADAGADCLYAPGPAVDGGHLGRRGRRWRPSRSTCSSASDFTTVAELAAVGVRRISVGGALARAAWTGFIAAATEIAEHGTFTRARRGRPVPRDRWPIPPDLNPWRTSSGRR